MDNGIIAYPMRPAIIKIANELCTRFYCGESVVLCSMNAYYQKSTKVTKAEKIEDII